ncbi:MAG: hypothetical protein ACRENG_31845, partial [bacterium]
MPLDDTSDVSAPLPKNIAQEQEWLAFTRFLIARHEVEAALAFLNKAILYNDNTELLLARAEARLTLGQKGEALADLQLVLNHDPASQRAQSLRQKILAGETSVITPMEQRQTSITGLRALKPVPTIGWHPKTAGQDLFEFSGWLN